MKPSLWITLFLVSTISCQNKPIAKTDMELVQGNWVLAGFKTDPTAKGTLTFNSNSTFTGTVDSEKAKAAGTQSKENTIAGTFSLSREAVTDENILFVNLVIIDPKKPAGSGTRMGKRLSYNPNQNVLTDLLMVYYARPEELEKVKQMLEDSRREAEARRGSKN